MPPGRAVVRGTPYRRGARLQGDACSYQFSVHELEKPAIPRHRLRPCGSTCKGSWIHSNSTSCAGTIWLVGGTPRSQPE